MVALAAFLCFGIEAIFVCCYEQKRNMKYETELILLKQQMAGIQSTVYVAAQDMQRGELATKEKLYEAEYCSSQPADWFMTKEEIGKELRVAVKEGTPLLTTMFLEEEAGGQREVFLSSIHTNENMEAGDRVDVRIVYRNGEDYVVLSDKELLLCETSGMVLLLSNEEIELLSSAMADEKQFSGTNLYAVRYPREKQTEKSVATYLPNKAVAGLLGRQEEQLEMREKLEQRLMQAEEAW